MARIGIRQLTESERAMMIVFGFMLAVTGAFLIEASHHLLGVSLLIAGLIIVVLAGPQLPDLRWPR
jgi:hypothetical protein